MRRMNPWWKTIGPGLVTGASDDDPAGIATYTQAGAMFGLGTLWMALFTLPLTLAIQEACARIALVSRQGLFALFRKTLPRSVTLVLLSSFLAANIFNLAADLNMMAASMQLLVPSPRWLWLVGFTALSLGLQVFLRYASYARVLRWLVTALLAYVAVLFFVDLPWREALRQTVWPAILNGKEFLLIVIAILGTTLSPYLYVWQASEELEESAECRREHVGRAVVCSVNNPRVLSAMRLDVSVGMVVSNLAFWCIVAASAATLHAHGITDVATADQAAAVLRPLVGPVATVLFTLGIVGTGLLTLPVLAGSAAYALAEVKDWRRSLNDDWRVSPKFYGAIAASMVLGLLLTTWEIPPIKMLLWSAIANALLAPPLLAGILWIGNRRDVMKGNVSGRWSNAGVGLSLVVMTVSAAVWAWLVFVT